MSVVKANAYGHGAVKIAQRLQELGTDYFAVAYTSEGVQLRENGIVTPILILHPQIHDLDLCIQHCLEPVIYGPEVLDAFIAFAKAKHTLDYPIHIEFNTGLNRIGFDPEQLQEIVTQIKSEPAIRVRGVQSHLAASEDHEEDDFTQQQINLFKNITRELEDSLGYEVIKHEANTSGLLNHDSSHFNMVRTGIGLYGYGNDPKFDAFLKPISSLRSQISLVRTIEKGESVSYNRKFIADHKMTYAVIALGHGDGIHRIHGYGNMEVSINGKTAPTLGIICMDMFMVDVTGIDCKVGDEVVIWDTKNQTARTVAENAGTISYELLTVISDRVPRVYID
jgi:alanine racemase